MVKIKEGYVMNPREQEQFDRVNALPRKASGTVAYYYKPQTKYPPRIYVFMHAEIWQDRNRRPMGLHTAFPFLTRPMNSGEIEYHHFDIRLCYHQYEDWGRLLYAEEKEAEQLDLEKPGKGTAFLERLRGYQPNYPIGERQVYQQPEPVVAVENPNTAYLIELMRKAPDLDVKTVGKLMEEEQQGQNRKVILILLREMFKAAAGAANQLDTFTTEIIQRKADRSEERSRKNFVRRVYRDNPLFALAEIRERYAGYEQDQLLVDLKKRKPEKLKRVKSKPILDLRRVQLQKLALKLELSKDDEIAYQAICERMAILAEAHRNRCPIPIAVKLQGESRIYYFNWKTRETVVKGFVAKANSKGMTHEVLQKAYNEIISSNYSF